MQEIIDYLVQRRDEAKKLVEQLRADADKHWVAIGELTSLIPKYEAKCLMYSDAIRKLSGED